LNMARVGIFIKNPNLSMWYFVKTGLYFIKWIMQAWKYDFIHLSQRRARTWSSVRNVPPGVPIPSLPFLLSETEHPNPQTNWLFVFGSDLITCSYMYYACLLWSLSKILHAHHNTWSAAPIYKGDLLVLLHVHDAHQRPKLQVCSLQS
jgi:hypothetical protein